MLLSLKTRSSKRFWWLKVSWTLFHFSQKVTKVSSNNFSKKITLKSVLLSVQKSKRLNFTRSKQFNIFWKSSLKNTSQIKCYVKLLLYLVGSLKKKIQKWPKNRETLSNAGLAPPLSLFPYDDQKCSSQLMRTSMFSHNLHHVPVKGGIYTEIRKFTRNYGIISSGLTPKTEPK